MTPPLRLPPPLKLHPLCDCTPVKVLENSRVWLPLKALVGNPLHWLHCAIFSTPTKHWAKRLQDLPGGFIAISEWGAPVRDY